MTDRPLLTVAQVAECLQLSVRQVRRLIKSGELKVHRIGRAVRIEPYDFAAFLARRRLG